MGKSEVSAERYREEAARVRRQAETFKYDRLWREMLDVGRQYDEMAALAQRFGIIRSVGAN